MKKEDIYNGITDIRDDLVENAGKRKVKKYWRGAVAAVLAAAVAIGGFAAWRITRGENEPDGGQPGVLDKVNAAALVSAVYPEREKYPQTDNGWGYDEEQYERWRQDSRDRGLTDEEREAMSGYFAAVLPELLQSEEGENAVCSPVNLYIALSMLAEVTGGQSRQQVLELLGSEDMGGQRALTKRVWNALYNDDGTYTSLLANSMWMRDDGGEEYETKVLRTLAEDYYASSFAGKMGSEGLNRLLHDWINDQTGGLLEEQIGDVALREETVLALVSTALFGDKWAVEFDPEKTVTQTFHAESGDVERDFMHKSMRSTYYWGDNFAAVELYFETGGSMRLLLPDEGVSMEEVLANKGALTFLTQGSVRNSVESKYMKINLAFPEFDVASDRELTYALGSLGVTDVFDPGRADFTPLVGDDNLFGRWSVYVSQVLHGARVKVDEEGCEAAAYTVIIGSNGSDPPPEQEEIDLTLDRPFAFSLMSQGVPMFAGVVNEP